MTLVPVDPAVLPGPDRAWFAPVNRTHLRVWEWGEPGDPPVICVHGAHDHGRMWDQLAPAIAGLGYRVLAIDVRGHGESGRLSSGHMWNVSTIDIGALARSLGRRVGLVGHSFGGGQVLSVAATWPELVAWIVNLDGLGPPAEAFEEIPLVDAATRSLAQIERQLGGARHFASLDELVDRRMSVNVRLPRSWVEHLVRHGHQELDGGVAFATDPLFNAGIPDDFSVEHATATFPCVVAPTLVLTGSEPDTWSDLGADEVGRRVALLGDARHEQIEGAGHYVHIEQPGATFDAIRRFVTGLEAQDDGDVSTEGVTPRAAAADLRADTAEAVDADPAVASDDPTPRLVVLHALGAEADGSAWRAAAGRWPGNLDAPDLPGHGTAPAPTGGHYEAGDVPFFVTGLFPPASIHRPVVLGVGGSGWSALVFALAGRTEGVVLLDGLGGPWPDAATAAATAIAWRRALLEDPDATSLHEGPGTDPRLRHRPAWSLSERLLARAFVELSVPLLVLESPSSTTAPEAARRLAGPSLRSIPSDDPDVVVAAIAEWVTAHERLRS